MSSSSACMAGKARNDGQQAGRTNERPYCSGFNRLLSGAAHRSPLSLGVNAADVGRSK
jgi:hypothetical protein